METSAKLYSLSFSNVKTYLFVFLFVAGNIALPQLCHLVPMGGPTCRSRCICCTIYKKDILSCIAWCDSCLPGDRHCF